MRRLKSHNPKELSRSAKFYAVLTVPDLLLIFISMFLSSVLKISGFKITLIVVGLILIRKFLNKKHNGDFIECKIKNTKVLNWSHKVQEIKKS